MRARRRNKVLAIIALIAGAQATAQQTPPALDEIVVTARPGIPPPRLDAVGYYQRHCFDAARRGRAFAPPVDDRDWTELDDRTRAQFGIADPAVPAFSLADASTGQTLVIKFERFAMPGRLIEHRCTLAIVGGGGHDAIEPRMSRLFGGGGTGRHVGGADGVDRLPGWRQRAWTGNPPRGSRGWRVFEGAHTAGDGTYLVVADRELFYRDRDFILGEAKTRTGPGRPLSVLTFAWTTRPD